MDENHIKLGRAIREYRRSLRLTQAQVGAIVGVAQNTVSAWERGDISSMRNWETVADWMGVDRDWFASLIGRAVIDAQKTARVQPAIRAAIGLKPKTGKVLLPVSSRLVIGDRNVPVYGRAVGGPDGKYEFNGMSMGYEVRPPVLDGVDGAYAIYADGESMWPRYKPGETLWINPHIPPRRGDDVVVQIHAAIDGETDFGYIKEFIGWKGDRLALLQYNPMEEIIFNRADVKSVHKIVFSNRP